MLILYALRDIAISMDSASLDLVNIYIYIYIFCEEKKFKALLIFVKHPYLYNI